MYNITRNGHATMEHYYYYYHYYRFRGAEYLLNNVIENPVIAGVISALEYRTLLGNVYRRDKSIDDYVTNNELLPKI
jgi:hypothetical protein